MTAKALELMTGELGLGRDLRAFLPELILCVGIVLMLLARLFRLFDRTHVGWLAAVFSLGAFSASCLQWYFFQHDFIPAPTEIQASNQYGVDLFGGMLVFDRFSIFIKFFLYAFTFLVIVLTLLSRIPDREDSADFFCLLLGSVVGMSIMASANHLLMVFMGIEMASVPSYAMAGFLKGRRQSSEAALKYVVYGGGAAGVMLYGISLIAGKFGTGYLPDVLEFLPKAFLLPGGTPDPLILMGLLFILVGVAFKLAAVPFHFWCPDVFEGASAEVAAFLSVASKGAALALLARIAMGLGGMAATLIPVLAFFAALTMTFGNLAAYSQTNLKRLLAYSTIAHAGFMMMGLATLTKDGVGAVMFYLMIYLVMNLGAFAVVAFLRNATGSEDLGSFRGVWQRSPGLVIALGVFLLSLLGLPPFAGFVAKFQIFAVLYDTAQDYQSLPAGHPLFASRLLLSYTLYALVVIGGINTVISLIYYMKVLKVMVIDKPLEEVEGTPVTPLAVPPAQKGFVGVLAIAVLGLGVFWSALGHLSIEDSVETFIRAVPAEQAKQGAE